MSGVMGLSFKYCKFGIIYARIKCMMTKIMKFFSIWMVSWLSANSIGWCAVRYVSSSGSHAPPYTSWATAANTIQAAVDAAGSGDTILVTNGIYNTGGRVVSGSLSNRLVISKAVTVRSVNGPDVTFIEGYACPTGTVGYGDNAVRCVYMVNNAVLAGFTLTNGHTLATGTSANDQNCGGGLYAAYASPPNAVVSNCIITGCSAYKNGGAVDGGKVMACVPWIAFYIIRLCITIGPIAAAALRILRCITVRWLKMWGQTGVVEYLIQPVTTVSCITISRITARTITSGVIPTAVRIPNPQAVIIFQMSRCL